MRKSVLSQAIAFDKIGGNYALSANSIKNMLIGVFLHAEFISAMKTVQNPLIFVKNAKKKKKKNRKMNSFGNFCSFFEVFTETLEQNIRKSHKKNVF